MALQNEPKTVEIGGNTFYIYPFAAFKASNISGELFSVLGPALSGLAGLKTADDQIDPSALASFFGTLSGDKIESLMRRLLVANKNISVEVDGAQAQWLTGDLADKIFCGAIGDMFKLAVEVIMLNFGGFFGELGGLFGAADTSLLTKISPDTES